MKNSGLTNSGFTLIEVLITLGLLVALVLGASQMMRASLDLRVSLSERNLVTNRVNTAMQRINEDLTHAFIVNKQMPGRSDKVTARTEFRIERSQDVLAMTYFGSRSLRVSEPAGDLGYVVYRLKEAEDGTGRTHLFRGSFPRVPQDFKEEPTMNLFTKNVHTLKFEPWDGDSWSKDGWDSNSRDTADRLPHMVRVTIKVWNDDPEPGAEPVEESETAFVQYSTIVYLPFALDFKELKQRPSSFRMAAMK